MSPLRIVIIFLLLYIGYRLIFGGRKSSGKKAEGSGKTGGEFPVRDVLMEDPVCNSLVPKQQAVVLEQDGETIYFCSEECRNQFMAQQGEQ